MKYILMIVLSLQFNIVFGDDAIYKVQDDHDRLVYKRYKIQIKKGLVQYRSESDGFFDSPVSMKPLAKVATLEDVKKGRAVFSFEGLGKRRVWKLEEFPVFSRFVSLKLFPYVANTGKTFYFNYGYVVQAEELYVDGKWKLYVGFVCRGGSGVFPASLINLSVPSKYYPAGCSGMTEIAGGIGWFNSEPYKIINKVKVFKGIESKDAIFVDIHITNCRGSVKAVPKLFLKNNLKGSQSLLDGIELKMFYAPFKNDSPFTNYPESVHYKVLELFNQSHFLPTKEKQFLKFGENYHVGAFEISRWIQNARNGYYQFYFQFDFKKMGLPDDPKDSGKYSFSFTLGSPPKKLTIKEMNRLIPIFGKAYSEQDLRDAINFTIHDSNSTKDFSNFKSLLSAKKLPKFIKSKRAKLSAASDTIFVYDMYNSRIHQSEMEKIFEENFDLIKSFSKYEQTGLLSELIYRFQIEKDFHLKLLIGTLLAQRGKSIGALFLLEGIKNNNKTEIEPTLRCLSYALSDFNTSRQEWIIDLAIAVLSDKRYVEKVGDVREYSTISSLADSEMKLTYRLGNTRTEKATLFLMELCRRTNGGFDTISSLGNTKDPRVIPVLLECLNKIGNNVEYKEGYGLPDKISDTISALAVFKDPRVGAVLLNYIEYPFVIEYLTNMKETKIIPKLKEMIKNRGAIIKNGIALTPFLNKRRFDDSKIAFAYLSGNGASYKLSLLLKDKDLGEGARRDIVWRLKELRNPESIEVLIGLIKDDDSGTVKNNSITVLRWFTYKAAVTGLIECFDVDYKGKNDSKMAYTPEMFKENIGESLKKLTGVDFRTDKDKWVQWWDENMDKVAGLK